MISAPVSLKRSFVGVGADIADLAGLKWTQTLSLRSRTIPPPALDRLDPFFDSLGGWDAAQREVFVDVERCERKRSMCSAKALIEIVTVHFCAKAVVQLGVHPQTGRGYIGWNDPEKVFAAEGHPLKPNHHVYDLLVRE